MADEILTGEASLARSRGVKRRIFWMMWPISCAPFLLPLASSIALRLSDSTFLRARYVSPIALIIWAPFVLFVLSRRTRERVDAEIRSLVPCSDGVALGLFAHWIGVRRPKGPDARETLVFDGMVARSLDAAPAALPRLLPDLRQWARELYRVGELPARTAETPFWPEIDRLGRV